MLDTWFLRLLHSSSSCIRSSHHHKMWASFMVYGRNPVRGLAKHHSGPSHCSCASCRCAILQGGYAGRQLMPNTKGVLLLDSYSPSKLSKAHLRAHNVYNMIWTQCADPGVHLTTLSLVQYPSRCCLQVTLRGVGGGGASGPDQSNFRLAENAGQPELSPADRLRPGSKAPGGRVPSGYT